MELKIYIMYVYINKLFCVKHSVNTNKQHRTYHNA